MIEEELAQLQRQVQRERTARKEAECLLEEKSLALYRANQQLQRTNAHSRLLLDSLVEGAYGVNIDGNCTFVNASCLRMLGYQNENELLGKHMHTLMHHSHSDGSPYPVSECSIYRAYQTGQQITISGEVFWRKDGCSFPVEYWSNPILVDGVVVGAILTFIDITERKQMEDQVRQLAFHDPLTKLPNRRLVKDRLAQAMAASKRKGCHGTLMFLDLDNFKPVNDTHGHAAGDLLLIEVADRLKCCVREMDTVGRIGGDEFVVMLMDLNTVRAKAISQTEFVAEKIRIRLSEPYLLTIKHEGEADTIVEHHCTASIGVALFSKYEASQDDILEWADKAMYQAKDAGRNLIRFYD